MAISSLILLLVLTTGNLLLRTTTASLLDDICVLTKNPGRCVALLKATDERAPVTTGPSLLESIAIEAAQGTAGNARITVSELANSAKDPKQKINYRNCENSYLDALDELNLGEENLEKRRIGKLLQTSQIVGRVVFGCAGAIRNTPSLKRANDDTILLGQLIGILARDI